VIFNLNFNTSEGFLILGNKRSFHFVLFLRFLSFILSFTLRKRFIEVDYHPGDLKFILFSLGVSNPEKLNGHLVQNIGYTKHCLKKHNDGSHILVPNKC
jgi:hypothetical protein